MTLSQHSMGLLFAMVAPAGAGKNSLMKLVMQRVDDIRQLPTATTRGIRPGEQPGREHLFISVEQFRQMISNDELLEWQEVHGRYYGIPRATLEDAFNSGEDLIADIDYKGATYARSQYPDNVILVFVQPPSVEVLIERMRARGENEEEIARRLVRVPHELAAAAECDYVIVNDDIDEAAESLRSIIIAERSRRAARLLREAGVDAAKPYTCVASAVVVHGNDVLTHNGSSTLPTTVVDSDEKPYDAALRALREWLDIPATHEYLVTGHGNQQRALIPPATIDFVQNGDQKQVNMIYVYRAPERITPPAGWTWTPQTQADLPEPVLDALHTSPT